MRTPLTSRALRRRMAGAGLMRRPGRGGGGGGSSLITMYGGGGFDTTNLLGSAAGGGYRGNVNGFTAATLVRINSQVNGGHINSYLDGSGKGYYFQQDSATTVRFICGNLAGNAHVSSPAYSPAADLGDIVLLVGRHTGTAGLISLWAADVKVGADVATTGYSLPSAALRHNIGTRNNGTGAHTGIDIFAWGGWDIALSDSQIHDLYDSVRTTGKLPTDITGTPSDTAMICNVADAVAGASFPSPIPSTVGAASFSVYSGAASGIDLVTVQVSP